MIKRLAFFLICMAACSSPLRAQETLPSVVVLADNNLSLAMATIVREYAKNNKTAVALGLITNQAETNQIAEGSNADVLITARSDWLEMLKQQGLVDIYSEVPVAEDRLALVAPPASRLQAEVSKSFPTGQMLTEMGDSRIFLLASPDALPEGASARAALRHMKADADLEPYTLYLKDRRTMHDMIRQQGAFGILLSSDAKQQQLRVVGTFPRDSSPPMIYRAVVLASENMNHARPFLEFLKSKLARDIFLAHGLAAP